MRIKILLFIAVLAGCPSEPVKGVCCVTDAQCAKLQLDEERPCDVGQSCKDNLCVATECSTSAECSDPGLPVCSLGICVAGCQIDQDCADVAGRPVCASDGMCVGCEDASQCPSADAALCDPETRSCRGCEQDSECPGGVCLEADGLCVADAEVVFLDGTSGNIGQCTRSDPCASIEFALTHITPQRRVIHALAGLVDAGTPPVVVNRNVYIDGTDTSIGRSGTPLFEVTGGTRATFGRLRLSSGRNVAVRNGAELRLFETTTSSLTTVDNATLDLRRSTFSAPGNALDLVQCTAGTLSVVGSIFPETGVSSTNCQTSIRQTRFEAGQRRALSVTGGQVTLENNVFVAFDGLIDVVGINNAVIGSIVRFNTFANTTPVASDGTALSCNSVVEVTSNVFAYRSLHPLGQPRSCAAAFSIFDDVAVADHTAGAGNKIGDINSFFVNLAMRDFHLSAGSLAHGAAEPGTGVTIDFDGALRPQPSGSVADAGAFEAP